MRCFNCGQAVEEERSFCTNCGSKFDEQDSIMRIVEDGPRVVSNPRTKRENYIKPLVLKVKNWSRKKKLAFIFIASLCIISILAVSIFNPFGTKKYRYDGEFALMLKKSEGKLDLYLGVPGEEETKIASDVSDSIRVYGYIRTGFNSRKYLYTKGEASQYETDGMETRGQIELYETDSEGNSEQIATGMTWGDVSPSPDLKKYLFVADDNKTLYLKEAGKEKVSIDDYVEYGYFLFDNETIVYQTIDRELYIKRKSGEVEEIDNNINFAFNIGYTNRIVYIKNDNELYYIDLNDKEAVRLGEYDLQGYSQYYNEKGDIAYIKDENLYCLREGRDEPAKLADKVTHYLVMEDMIAYKDYYGKWFSVKIGSKKVSPLPSFDDIRGAWQYNDYIYYLKQSNTLYMTENGSEREEKLYENVSSIYDTEKDLYFSTTEKDTLFKVKKGASITKVQEHVKDVQYEEDSYFCYLTESGDLYVDEEKYSGVKAFRMGGRNVCYVSTDDELYLIDHKSSSKKISDDVSGYEGVFFGGARLGPIVDSRGWLK